jgi:hypothetical protein
MPVCIAADVEFDTPLVGGAIAIEVWIAKAEGSRTEVAAVERLIDATAV